MKRKLACGVILAMVLSLGVAGAQEFRATVNGRVTDTTQAAVPSAAVLVQNVETGEVATVKSNTEGNYSVPFLRPGAYLLSVEAPGFKKYSRRLRLEVSQTATVNVELSVGNLAEEVSVIAETPLLDSSKADRGTVIDNLRVTELPLNARNPFMLSMLVAGVNYNGPAIYHRPFDNGAIADWSVNGGQNRNNEFLLDGAPNNAIQGGNNIAYVPPVDAVQEFKIITNSYDAQYGRTAGGIVNVSLKSGTNTLHGTVYEFMRRKWLDANSLLLNARGAPKSEHYLDQYGFQLDGPIRLPGYDGRNKTFFLFNYEGYREGTPSPLFSTVPTEAFRRGDFSGLVDSTGRLITIYDPATGRNVNGVWVRDPFPGNIIPANRIHPLARNLMGYYPAPNTTTAGVAPWQSNLSYLEHINRDKYYNWVAKIDHNFGTQDRMFMRYGQNNRNEIRNFNAIPSGVAQDGQLPLERINRTGVIDWVHIFGGSSAVLNVRASASRYVELARTDPGLGFNAAELGFPQGLVDALPLDMFPRIQAQVNAAANPVTKEFEDLGRGAFNKEPTNVFSLQPNVSLSRGAHSVRFGVETRLTQYSRQVSGFGGMRLIFDRTFTQRDFATPDSLSGNSFASMLLGAPVRGEIDDNVFPIYMSTYVAPWIQDDWRIGRKLTLNLGLRWDLNTAPRERYDQMNYEFDAETVNPVSNRIDQARFPGYAVRGGLEFAGVDGNSREPWALDKDNIQARLGAIYQLNDKTILRGGYGRYYMNPPSYGFTQGFSLQTPFVGSLDANRTPLYNLGNPFPSVVEPPGSSLGVETFLGRAISYTNADFEMPYVDQFSIGVQRQLPWNTVVELSYVGSRSRKLQTSFGGINEPPLSFRERCDVTRGGSAAFCNELLPNPFFGVPGFEGTGRFTSPTLSRYELNRPFPQFGAITEAERNDGTIWYDSLQLVVNKRMSHGLTLNTTYTYVPRFEEEATGGTAHSPGANYEAFIDLVARTPNRGPYLSHRPHRLTASGVWLVPVGKGRRFASDVNRFVDRIIGGWELAGMFIYQSGRPWDLPGTLEIVKDPFVPVNVKGGQFIQGVQPCVAELRGGAYQLLPYSVAAGCTEAYFQVRAPFQTRTTPFRDDRLRRPSYMDLTMNLAKTTQITDRVKLQIRVEAFNVLNSAMYDERQYVVDHTNNEFGKINKNTVTQSNFPRFIQLGFKLLF
jgi:carboxypeptidase family protein